MAPRVSPAPTVSVVIPTYQRRDLVRRAIASVRAQTHRDYELIVVDDGSTDDTHDVVAALGDDIVYVRRDENRGVSAARNAGIARARGAIVAFLDSDDTWLPHHLAVVMDVLTRLPDAVLCSTSPRFEVEGREPPAEARVADTLSALLVENVVGSPSSVAVRRAALERVGGFGEALRVMEGWDLWMRLALVGPFALLRHRTIVTHPTRGSLTEESARNGEYVRALDLMGDRVGALAAHVRARGDGTALASRAAGLAAYLTALRAIACDDETVARGALATACAALPELAREPQLVANRLALLRFGAAGRLRSFATAADLWPDRRADTAVYLRFHAVALALRLGCWPEAARLLRSWPLAATPAFFLRSAPLFLRLGRRTLKKLGAA